jgi:integrase
MPKLTTRTIEAIKPSEARREIPDSLLPSLYLVVQPSGAKSWATRYRHNGLSRKHTLGSYPAIDLKTARQLGAKALRAAAEGKDPAREKTEARITKSDSVEAIVREFLQRHCKPKYRPRSYEEAERLLRLHVLPRWRDRTISSITRSDVRDMLDRVVKSGAPIGANRTHSLVRKLFNWCVEHEIVPASPVAGVRRPTNETSRDRVLADDEIARIWKAAEKVGPPFQTLLQLLTLTGQRRGEAVSMEWSEIDLKRSLWSIPKEKTKNGRAHDVPLSPLALSILKKIPRGDDRYVISYGDGPISGFSKSKRRLDALLDGVQPWCLHDIRRSVASGLARLGFDLPTIERVLNHVSGSFGGIVGVYQRHDYADQKRKALDAWAKHIAEIVAP